MSTEIEQEMVCRCGHLPSRHDFAGCAGDRLRHCTCERDEHGAIVSVFETPPMAAPSFTIAYTARRGVDAA